MGGEGSIPMALYDSLEVGISLCEGVVGVKHNLSNEMFICFCCTLLFHFTLSLSIQVYFMLSPSHYDVY